MKVQSSLADILVSDKIQMFYDKVNCLCSGRNLNSVCRIFRLDILWKQSQVRSKAICIKRI